MESTIYANDFEILVYPSKFLSCEPGVLKGNSCVNASLNRKLLRQ